MLKDFSRPLSSSPPVLPSQSTITLLLPLQWLIPQQFTYSVLLVSWAAVCHTLPLIFMSRGCWISICSYTWFSNADTGFLVLVILPIC